MLSVWLLVFIIGIPLVLAVYFVRPKIGAYDAQALPPAVIIGTGSKKIQAYIHQEPGSSAWVILAHGHTQNASDLKSRLDFYRTLGCSCLLYDQPAHGKSSGWMTSFGLHEGWAVDVVWNYLHQHYNPNKVILHGFSMGAISILGAHCKNQADYLILEAPFDSLHHAIMHRIPVYLPKIIPRFLGVYLGWMISFFTHILFSFKGCWHNPYIKAKEIKVPSLWVAGGLDVRVYVAEIVRMQQTTEALSSILVLPQFDHTMLAEQAPCNLDYQEKLKVLI